MVNICPDCTWRDRYERGKVVFYYLCPHFWKQTDHKVIVDQYTYNGSLSYRQINELKLPEPSGLLAVFPVSGCYEQKWIQMKTDYLAEPSFLSSIYNMYH